MFKLKNPLPQQLRDTKKVRLFYKEYNLVPYAEYSMYSSHKMLKVLTDLAQLSGTHGSCIKDLTKWAFGGELNFYEKAIPGLKQDRNKLSDAEEVRIALELEKYGVTPTLISKLTKKLFQSKKKTGMAYLRYKEIKVGGTKRVFLEALPPRNVMFLNTKEGEPMSVVVSQDFLQRDNFESEPDLIRVFPDFSGDANERETVIVLKEEDEDSLWYGRPDSIQALYWMATEWYDALHSLKVTQSETVAKAIIAAMNPDPNSLGQGESAEGIIKQNRVAINELTTNKGNDQEVDSVGYMGYPFGGEAPTMMKLDINRDHQFKKVNTGIASDYIVAAHCWDKVLLGFDRPSSGIGGNVLVDTFEVKNTSTIKPIQREYEADPWGKVFKMMADFTGIKAFGEISPRFSDRIKDLLESMDGRERRRTNSNGNGNQDTDNTRGGQGTGED